MNLGHRSQDGIDIVSLPERLMMADAPDVRARLKEVIAAGSGRLILDLGHTDFMDSSGCAVLVSALQVARKRGGDVYLVSMGSTVRALIELTRLHLVFPIYDDETLAVRAFAALPPGQPAAG